MLIALLLPAMNAAREAARQTVCGANLRQIGLATRAYAADWKDAIHSPPSRHRWRWITATPPLEMIPANDRDAYWGVAYLPYLTSGGVVASRDEATERILAAARRIFNCPSARWMNPAFGNTDRTTPGHYGINYFITGKYPSTKWKKLSTFSNSSQTIFCQDAFEHRLGGSFDPTYTHPEEAGNTLSDFGGGRNLVTWRLGGAANGIYTPNSENAVAEYFRHRKRCQILWLDGHVSTIAKSLGTDVPASYYWGKANRPL